MSYEGPSGVRFSRPYSLPSKAAAKSYPSGPLSACSQLPPTAPSRLLPPRLSQAPSQVSEPGDPLVLSLGGRPGWTQYLILAPADILPLPPSPQPALGSGLRLLLLPLPSPTECRSGDELLVHF